MGRRPVPKHECMRCNVKFFTERQLKLHVNNHINSLEEIKLLQEGHMPDETKIGTQFKGRNRVIVS
ncbi:MAG: hypothetical protein V1802_03230 [Candidatus Aenigmatarchaeota archaeon]